MQRWLSKGFEGKLLNFALFNGFVLNQVPDVAPEGMTEFDDPLELINSIAISLQVSDCRFGNANEISKLPLS